MIYLETTFVNPATTQQWFSLSVVNMWDVKTHPCCFKNGIPFCLKKNTAKNSVSWESVIVVPTEEQKAEIFDMGYNCA
jgi:hypothetical protein